MDSNLNLSSTSTTPPTLSSTTNSATNSSILSSSSIFPSTATSTPSLGGVAFPGSSIGGLSAGGVGLDVGNMNTLSLGGGGVPGMNGPMLAAPIGQTIGPRRRGSCKFFNSQKGFGFINDISAEELGGQEVFVHYTAIAGKNGFRSLAEGEEVEYSIVQGPKGFQAANVTGPGGRNVMGDPKARLTKPPSFMQFAPIAMPGYGIADPYIQQQPGVYAASPYTQHVVYLPSSALSVPSSQYPSSLSPVAGGSVASQGFGGRGNVVPLNSPFANGMGLGGLGSQHSPAALQQYGGFPSQGSPSQGFLQSQPQRYTGSAVGSGIGGGSPFTSAGTPFGNSSAGVFGNGSGFPGARGAVGEGAPRSGSNGNGSSPFGENGNGAAGNTSGQQANGSGGSAGGGRFGAGTPTGTAGGSGGSGNETPSGGKLFGSGSLLYSSSGL